MSKQTQNHEGYLDGQQIDGIEGKAHLLRSQAMADTINFLFRRNTRR